MNYGPQVTCGDFEVLWKRLKAVRVAQTMLQCVKDVMELNIETRGTRDLC